MLCSSNEDSGTSHVKQVETVLKNERCCQKYCEQHGMVSRVWLIRLRIRFWRIIVEDIGVIAEEHCE